MNDLRVRAAFLAGLLLLLIPAARSGAADTPTNGIATARIVVQAVDSKGRPGLRALGFQLDENTVVTSYDSVREASGLQLTSSEYSGYSTRVISCSNFMDLALVKTSADMPMDPALAASDSLAAGDPVYYLAPEKKDWRIVSAQVKSYRDSGQGYELMQIEPALPGTSSPLFNSDGKVVGWVRDAEAAPMKAIYFFFADKDSAVPLSELKLDGKYWSVVRTAPTAPSAARIETGGMKEVRGPSRYPFQLSLPAAWPFQTSNQPEHYLLLSMNGRFGISVALRAIPAQQDDLMAEMDRVENLMFPGIPRAEMEPFSADHFTGMKALYEETDMQKGFASSLFCVIANRSLYVLTVTYPRKYEEEIQPLVVELFSSFRV